MPTLNQVDLIRIAANSVLNAKTKASLGQFFTNAPISLFMASLFENISGEVHLLDPGCGPCSLTAAFTDEAVNRGKIKSLKVNAFDIEPSIEKHITESLNLCENYAVINNVKFEKNYEQEDYILHSQAYQNSSISKGFYSHILMNPPYKKITSKSQQKIALNKQGIDAVNLYSGFVSLAIQQLKIGGELVAIIPRSFCNGPYYQAFRELILKETAIRKIHLFDSRTKAFSEDSVLQENIIIHLVKGAHQGDVTITSSPTADFSFDKETSTITATDKTIRKVSFESIVKPNDNRKFFHIAANNRDQLVIDKLSIFKTTLDDLEIKVSTGPVVDFRLKDDLKQSIEEGAVPLIYPIHLNGSLRWPMDSKKPNAIAVTEESKRWLWKNKGHFIIVRRFSSKEEKRRIVANLYDSSLPSDLIGFENKLNVFHLNKQGLNKIKALGLFIFLNSTLLDKYYRIFSGHTQVNATDLRSINYPSIESLENMGKKAKNGNLTQEQIDKIIDEEIFNMTGEVNNEALDAQEKIDQALEILKGLGMPRAQLNERSALTLLALLDLKPDMDWSNISQPMIGVTPIMTWCREVYGKEYQPNTRETFRRQTLHQFIDGGMCLYNPDDPKRPVNSPKACYQVATELLDIIKLYNTDGWEENLEQWLSQRKTLVEQYAKERNMNKIPLTFDGTKIELSPGVHSQLIHDIVMEFGPRFAPESEVIYIGDTGSKQDFLKKDRLIELGITVNEKGKLPDVVLYWPEKDWLLLIESVTSHGPVDGKRHKELSTLFEKSKPGLVYVTAFPNRKTMAKYVEYISWETEVWIAEDPTHMVHFNGDKFLGPH